MLGYVWVLLHMQMLLPGQPLHIVASILHSFQRQAYPERAYCAFFYSEASLNHFGPLLNLLAVSQLVLYFIHFEIRSRAKDRLV